MANLSMSYETIMIFNTKAGEEGIKALSDKFKALISENTTVDKVEEWGKRRLAYPIEDEMDGYYLYIEFTCKPDFPAELDRVYKITDGVLRSLIVRKEETEAAAPAKVPAPAAAPAVEAAEAAPKTENAAENVKE